MDAINLGAFLTFVFVTTFTPGPNNITSSSMGILYGYRSTLPYLLGIMMGFFGIMLLAGVISGTLYAIFPSLEAVMRFVGAAYILWLAYKTFKSSVKLETEADTPVLGFLNGFLLQALNPKVWVYGLTIYTTFLAPIASQVGWLALSALFLACVGFTSISTWTLGGAAIKHWLQNPTFQKGINAVLSLLLVYTAIDLSGIL